MSTYEVLRIVISIVALIAPIVSAVVAVLGNKKK